MSCRNSEDDEIEILLTALSDAYGYDFRQYSRAHIKRRVMNRLTLSRLGNIEELQKLVLKDEKFAAQNEVRIVKKTVSTKAFSRTHLVHRIKLRILKLKTIT